MIDKLSNILTLQLECPRVSVEKVKEEEEAYNVALVKRNILQILSDDELYGCGITACVDQVSGRNNVI